MKARLQTEEIKENKKKTLAAPEITLFDELG